MGAVTLTMQVSGVDHDLIDGAMVRALEQRGYTVIAPGGRQPVSGGYVGAAWETPSDLAARLGLHLGSVSRSLARGDCPAPARFERGEGGRMIRLVTTAGLDAWLTRHKKGAHQ